MTPKTMDVLRKTPLFATLPDDDLRRVADLAVSRRFAKKEAVFREGDRAEGFFIVVSGKVKVFKLSGEGKEQILHVLEAGQTFAEAVIFEGGGIRARRDAHRHGLFPAEAPVRRPAGTASESCDPDAGVPLPLAQADDRSRGKPLFEGRGDASGLLPLGGTQGARHPPEGRGGAELPIGKNVLASRLGTVPETFSRTLKKLQDDGLIAVRGKRIRIVSAERLFSILLR